MWPSFSLWAWRILKIRSCLRSPLAPGISSVRAMLLSSVMFFSFNSEMVIFTYGGNYGRGLSGRNLAGLSRFERFRRGRKGPNRAALKLRGAVGSEKLPGLRRVRPPGFHDGSELKPH